MSLDSPTRLLAFPAGFGVISGITVKIVAGVLRSPVPIIGALFLVAMLGALAARVVGRLDLVVLWSFVVGVIFSPLAFLGLVILSWIVLGGTD